MNIWSDRERYLDFVGPGWEAFWIGFLAALVGSFTVAAAALAWSRLSGKRWAGIYRAGLLLLVVLFGLAGVAGLLLIYYSFAYTEAGR